MKACLSSREYLAILYLAARESESQVDEILRGLLAGAEPITSCRVHQLVQSVSGQLPRVTDGDIAPVNLSSLASIACWMRPTAGTATRDWMNP